MYRTAEEIKIRLIRVTERLRQIAMEDEIITPDEQTILDIVKTGVKNLEIQVIQVLESDLGEEEFQDLVIEVFNDIIKNVVTAANLDGIITSDEQKLIDQLREIVNTGGILLSLIHI